MSNIFTLTVTDPARDTRAAEVQLVARALNIAAHDVRAQGGQASSGNIIDDGGKVIGAWSYTATATKTG